METEEACRGREPTVALARLARLRRVSGATPSQTAERGLDFHFLLPSRVNPLANRLDR